VHGGARVTSTLDVVAAFLAPDATSVLAGYVASNTSIRLAPRHALTLNAVVAGQAISDAELGAGSRVGALLVALTYEGALSRRFSLSVTIGNAALVAGSAESLGGSVELGRGLGDDPFARSFARALASVRFSRRVALSGGAWVSPAIELPLPSLALDVLW
jgi:hypothetical protein